MHGTDYTPGCRSGGRDSAIVLNSTFEPHMAKANIFYFQAVD